MKRALAISTALVITAAAAALLSSRSADSNVPLFTVSREHFVRQVTADGNLKARTATPVSSPSEAPGPLKIAWIAPDGSAVKKGEVIVRFDPSEFENALTGGNEDRTTSVNRLTKHDSDSSATRTNLQRDARQAQAELEAAKRMKIDDDQIVSRYEKITSQLDQELAEDRKKYSEGVLEVREELARANRDLVMIDQRKADLKIRNASQGLRALEVTAPNDGILVLTRDWRGESPRVGATVWSGSPIAEIPQLDIMQAEVFVLEADAAGVAIGKKAVVTLSADPSRTYEATISRVDKLARPRLRGVPVQYFGVTLDLTKTDVARMKPGSRVSARLMLDDTANAISVPRQALFDVRGKKVVYVRKGSTFKETAIEVAANTPGRVVITKGLETGDMVALRDPTLDQQKTAASGERAK